MPTASASGAMIGIDNVASPEDEFIKKPSTTKINIIITINRNGFIPDTIPDNL